MPDDKVTPPLDEALKACPFCGHATAAISDGNNGLHFRVICGKGSCRAAGPLERCTIDAIVAWNSRPTEAPQAEATEEMIEAGALQFGIEHQRRCYPSAADWEREDAARAIYLAMQAARSGVDQPMREREKE